MFRKLQLFVFILLTITVSTAKIHADSSSSEKFYQQFKDYFAQPILQVLKPELLQDMMLPHSEDNKPYVTIDGIEKVAWSERIKQRNEWRNKSIIDTVNIDSILRMHHHENADNIFTVSDGIEGLDPTNPDVAYDPVNQKYLVVWEEETSPGNFSIMGQFRDRNGMPMGSPTNFSPARTTQGCFYASFDTDNGAVSTPGNCPKAANPAVAYNNGRFLIAWELKGRGDHARNSDGSANEEGKNFSNIIAKVVNATNLTPVSPAWAEGILISRVWISSNVGTPVANDSQVQAWAKSINPDVSPKLGGDGFVVTWESDKDFIGCVDSARRASSSVFARYVDHGFSATGGASNKPIFTVYTDPSTATPACPTLNNVMKASKPRIAYNTTRSDFVIAFEYGRAAPATKVDIAAKKVTLNNSNDATVTNAMAADVIASAPEGTSFHNPDVASYAANTLLAYDDGTNIFMKKFTTNASAATPVGDATSIALGGTGAKTEPRIASNLGVGGTRAAASMAPQRALVAYTQGGAMKWAITDDMFMVLRGPGTFPVMANNNHLAEVASDSSNFLVAWAGTPAGSMIENVFGASVNSQDDLAAVTLTAPADNAVLTGLSVNLTWNAVAGEGIVYDVYLGVGGAAPMMISTGQAATNFTVNNLTWGSSYQWRVVVRDAFGRTGSSATRNFSTIPGLAAPVLTGPANMGNVATPSANLTWNAVPNAMALGAVYDVFEGLGALPAMPVASGINVTNYTVNGLVSQTSRQWKVRVRDMHGRSAESEVRTYNVGNLNMPTAPALAAQPADNVTWAPTRLYLSWMPATDADVGDTVTYDVYFVQGMNIPMGAPAYRTGVAGTSFVIQASTDNRPQFQPNVPGVMPIYLAPNTNYAWKICANDGRSNPAGVTCSPVRRFNTDNSVVGWWRFDENPAGPLCAGAPMGSGKTVCDYSGNNNHGVPNGGPMWMPPPDPMLLGGALQFDGVNDWVEISNSMITNPNDVSVIAKLNITDLVASNNQVVDKRSDLGVEAGYNLRVVGVAYPLNIQWVIARGVIESITIANSLINQNTWYVISASYNDTTKNTKIYIDGSNVQNGNAALDTSVKSTYNLTIGEASVPARRGPSSLNGIVSDTIVLNKVISVEENTNIYNSN